MIFISKFKNLTSNIKMSEVYKRLRNRVIYSEEVILKSNNASFSSHLKEDLIIFINKWNYLLDNITPTMISNLNKLDYNKNLPEYYATCTFIFDEIKNHLSKHLKMVSKPSLDYEQVKHNTLYLICCEEFVTNVKLPNSFKDERKKDELILQEKLRSTLVNFNQKKF
jgi:hypothetical protein